LPIHEANQRTRSAKQAWRSYRRKQIKTVVVEGNCSPDRIGDGLNTRAIVVYVADVYVIYARLGICFTRE